VIAEGQRKERKRVTTPPHTSEKEGASCRSLGSVRRRGEGSWGPVFGRREGKGPL